MNWDRFSLLTELIVWSLFSFYIVYIFVTYVCKPAKLFREDKILFSSMRRDIISLAFFLALIGLNFFYIFNPNHSSDIILPFIIAYVIFSEKPSCLIISDKKFFHKRQIISADKIEEIKRNYHSLFKTADISLISGQEISIRTPKKVIKSIKQFCEINEIEYKE